MSEENQPRRDEEGSGSQKNKCRFTSRGEAKPETAYDSVFTIIEVMVPFCPVCRTYGDFFIFTDIRKPIPQDYLNQECGLCKNSMLPIIAGFLYLRTPTKEDITGRPAIQSPQLGLDFGLHQQN